jgi:hypothetical protein
MERKEESVMETRTAANRRHKHAGTRTETNSLKGTLASVLLLGAFIVVSWFAVFGLFLSRA